MGLLVCATLGAGLALGPTPPAMTERQIGPPTEITGGTVSTIQVGELQATVFRPDGVRLGRKPRVWLHFHTAPWFIVNEFQRAGWKVPLVVFNFGQGSKVYGDPFALPGSFAAWQEQIFHAFGMKQAQWGVTSFSAGYGAVRNLIADKEFVKNLHTVILADSMYGSLDPAATERKVAPEHLAFWDPIVLPALKKKMKVIMTTSEITPDSYAGTWEVAQGLVRAHGGEMVSHETTEPFGLLRTFDRGSWHVWSYDGHTPEAHMTHPRHLAELLIESQK